MTPGWASPSAMTPGWGPGYHGKLPAQGDFVAASLPRGVLDVWDGWLSTTLGEARRLHGPEWDGLFAAAPGWRFALAAGVCGPAPLAGVWVPSMDRVGRLYPLALLAPLPWGSDLASVPADAAGWFDRAELLLRRVVAGGASLPQGCRMLGRPDPVAGVAGRVLVQGLLGPLDSRASLWWSRGSAAVAPSLLTCRGLPDSLGFAAFLDGAWGRWGWRDLETAG